MSRSSQFEGHVFISYVREDTRRVDQLQQTLEAAGIRVWRDTADLWPGEDWRRKIRLAITDDALVFVACFSHQSLARNTSYQNEEIVLAIDQLRLRRPDVPWIIPVRFDDCDIPDRDIGAGRTLSSIQRADLFGNNSDAATSRLVTAVQRILARSSGGAAAINSESRRSHRNAASATVEDQHADWPLTAWESPAVPRVVPVSAGGLSDYRWHVRSELEVQGYALTTERDIGLPEKCAKGLQETYFDSGQLRHDVGDYPEDRERARDVVFYEWNNDDLTLAEYETIAIQDRIGHERIHKRIELLRDPQARDLIETFIGLVPANRRHRRGTFGINLFRTHTDIATKPHRHEEEFVILYVISRHGNGAESYLYTNDGIPPGSPENAEFLLRKQLDAGDIMIFEDRRFMYGATPFTPPPGGQATRDVLLCTVDYPNTYLERDLTS